MGIKRRKRPVITLTLYFAISVKTADGSVELLSVQPEGKRPMSPAEFLNGKAISTGDHFELPAD